MSDEKLSRLAIDYASLARREAEQVSQLEDEREKAGRFARYAKRTETELACIRRRLDELSATIVAHAKAKG